MPRNLPYLVVSRQNLKVERGVRVVHGTALEKREKYIRKAKRLFFRTSNSCVNVHYVQHCIMSHFGYLLLDAHETAKIVSLPR